VILFWGIVVEEVARDTVDEAEWPERVLRAAAGADASAIRCVLSRYGTLAALKAYAAIAESEIVAPGLRATPIAPPHRGEDWEARLRRFCALLDVPWSPPAWHVAALLEH
jgi:hypothetical protein